MGCLYSSSITTHAAIITSITVVCISTTPTQISPPHHLATIILPNCTTINRPFNPPLLSASSPPDHHDLVSFTITLLHHRIRFRSAYTPTQYDASLASMFLIPPHTSPPRYHISHHFSTTHLLSHHHYTTSATIRLFITTHHAPHHHTLTSTSPSHILPP